ncbi:MAG: inositol monophosphatase family protein [Candidatus Eisenbacteria bacterium]
MSGDEDAVPPNATPPAATLRDAAIAMAEEAGAVLLEGYGQAHVPELKGRIDLVTLYDRRSEELILARIRERFPGSAVLAEESGAHERATGASLRWIVDPLDGTTNYAHNYPFFSVSIAAESAGEVVAGAVFDPVAREMFAAARGAGATLNGRPIRVSSIAALDSALLVTGFPYDVREHPERVLPAFQAFLARAQGIRRDGSATLNLCYTAMGRFDGFWEPRLAAWDTAAGALMVREAGGRVTDYRGSRFDPEGGEILATNAALHAEMMSVLEGAGARGGPRGT